MTTPLSSPPGGDRIAVIGLGYVGLPLAVALARRFDCIGIDIDSNRIAELKAGHDRTREVTPDTLADSGLCLSEWIEDAQDADIFIVTVPTPVDRANQPDLRPVLGATRAIAAIDRKNAGTILVYESTVYPGVTEDVCGPERGRDRKSGV